MDQETTLQSLKDHVQDFCESRGWDPFHGAKDLAIGVVTEGAELLEPFRFQTEEQIKALLQDDQQRQAISEELADVLFFLIRFSQKFDFDLSLSFQKKMDKNAKKYPVSEFYGKNHKSLKRLDQ